MRRSIADGYGFTILILRCARPARANPLAEFRVGVGGLGGSGGHHATGRFIFVPRSQGCEPRQESNESTRRVYHDGQANLADFRGVGLDDYGCFMSTRVRLTRKDRFQNVHSLAFVRLE